MNNSGSEKCVLADISPMRSPGRQRERGVWLVLNFPPVWAPHNGHILAVIVAPVGRTGAFYIWLSPHSQAEGRAVEIWPKNRGCKGLWVPGGLLDHRLSHNHPVQYYLGEESGGIGTKKEGDSADLLFQQYTGVCNQQKLASKYRGDQTSWLQSVSVLKANIFSIQTFIRTLWLEELFLYNVSAPQKGGFFSWASTFICTNLKAYWYSLWTSRWKMPHFLLVMVINSLSIDPECLNLTQRYLIIYMVPFLSFVSSTLDETSERGKKTLVLFCPKVIGVANLYVVNIK